MKLEGQTALVTGASRGIGAGIARALAKAGARVVVIARSKALLDRLATEIGNGSVAIEADLSTEGGATQAADAVRTILSGAPEILVNNAGVFGIAPLREASVSDFSSSLRINLLAPFTFVREFLPAMLDRKSGHIVTVGSVSDRTIFAGNAAYAATKFGARAMHEVLREETRGTGVRATLVSPSSVDTDIWDSVRFADGSAPDRSGMLNASSVADAVLFAISRHADVNIDELRLSRS